MAEQQRDPSNGRWSSWQIANVVLTVLVVPLIGAVGIISFWAFNSIVDLLVSLGRAESVIESHRLSLIAVTAKVDEFPDRVVPADFKQDFIAFKTEMGSKLDKLSNDVSSLTGAFKEHSSTDRMKTTQSPYRTDP